MASVEMVNREKVKSRIRLRVMFRLKGKVYNLWNVVLPIQFLKHLTMKFMPLGLMTKVNSASALVEISVRFHTNLNDLQVFQSRKLVAPTNHHA